MRVLPIEILNRDAARNQYDLEALPWNRGVDPTKKWCPDLLTHLYYCPSFSELRPEEKLFYNQLFALGISEQFVLLEELLLVHGMNRIIDAAGNRLSPAMREAMQNLIEEEKKHSAMFRRLGKVSLPEIYLDDDFAVYSLPKWDRKKIELFLSATPLFICWVWICVLFEEKALDFYRKYMNAPDRDEIDPLYRAAHRYHAQEETRHFQIDHHFVEIFWDPAPSWKKRLNEWIFYRLMKGFANPRRTVERPLDLLVQRFPRLAPMRARLSKEASEVRNLPSWQEASYSRKSLPWTFELFDRYPELHQLCDIFPAYDPPVEPKVRPAPAEGPV